MNIRARQAAKEMVPKHKVTKNLHVKLMTLLEKLDEKSLREDYREFIKTLKVYIFSSAVSIHCLMLIII